MKEQKTAEILAVGTELLLGQIANTDAQYLSQRMSELGIAVYHHQVVGDNRARLLEVLELALGRSDIVIATGGLGPTQDDLTKETVAEFMGLPMELDAPSLAEIESFFAARGRQLPMTENNRKQAMAPKGAIILKNECGTAPGCIVERDGKCIVVLPGPPVELKDMFEKTVYPYLRTLGGEAILSRYIRLLGRGESMVEGDLQDLIEAQGEVTIAPYAGTGEVMLRVTARAANEGIAWEKMRPTIEAIRTRLGEYIYDIRPELGGSIENSAAEAVLAKQLRVSFAESLTGGLACARFVSIPGVSAALRESFVTYSNEAKIALLGVKPETLEAKGAVSEETAREMAEGLLARGEADIAVSLTGIAGPDGGSEEKPVGLCYIGLATAKNTEVRKFGFWGSRENIRHQASNYALDMLRRCALIY